MTAAELSARFSAHPSMVLAAYVEPLARGRRVAIFGDASTGLAERICERGARLCHSYDPDPARSAEAVSRVGLPRPPSLQHAALGPDLGVRDGAFDLVLVPDLSLFTEAAELLRRARRLLGPSGAAVVASPNPAAVRRVIDSPRAGEPLGYYELYDLVALQFSVVRMVGQAPFVGYAVADFANEDEEPEVSVDTSLLESSEEPEWFLAIASERPVELDPYAVIEVPFGELTGEPPTVEVEPVTAPLEPRRDPRSRPLERPATAATPASTRVAEAESRLALVTAELERMRDRQREEAREVEARAGAMTAMSARLVELEAEVAKKAARLREIEGKVGDDHVRAERLAHDLREVEEQLRQQRDRATRLAKQLDDEKKARTKSDVELGMIRSKPELSGAKDRLDALAAELDAARQRIIELEAATAATQSQPRREDTEAALRVVELQSAMRDAQREVADLASQRDIAQARVAELEQALAVEVKAREELMVLYGATERRWSALADERDRSAVEAHAAEVQALEAALAGRGREVARLTRDLCEAERVGRELVDEMESLARSVPGGVADSTGEAFAAADEHVAALKGRLDSLASSAAKCQADLQAATWRVAELERRLLEAEASKGADPATTHRELEQALVAAHQELASLRQAVPAPQGPGEPARGVVEQSVLLQQLAGERG